MSKPERWLQTVEYFLSMLGRTWVQRPSRELMFYPPTYVALWVRAANRVQREIEWEAFLRGQRGKSLIERLIALGETNEWQMCEPLYKIAEFWNRTMEKLGYIREGEQFVLREGGKSCLK